MDEELQRKGSFADISPCNDMYACCTFCQCGGVRSVLDGDMSTQCRGKLGSKFQPGPLTERAGLRS